MTIRTLKAKIKSYKEYKQQIDDLEAIKEELQKAIIAEFEQFEEGQRKLDGLQLVTFTREYMTKKDTPQKIWEHYKGAS